jgi:DNA-binding response OmpR family regulator
VQEGFELEAYHTGEDAASQAVAGDYALVVLDVMLPETNGFEIHKDIRRRTAVRQEPRSTVARVATG